MAKRKKNYLNNKDMLKQIHLSKITYCKFINPVEDNQQDIILEDVADINGDSVVPDGKDDEGNILYKTIPTIIHARQLRATRLNKLNDTALTIDDIKDTDVVFRIMTTEHIPLVPKKKAKKKAKKKKAIITDLFEEFNEDDLIIKGSSEHTTSILNDEVVEMVPMRCKFLSFFHYRIDENQKPYVVGKSHWKGESITDGEFCMNHGSVTNTLATMYMKLCERYATRANWRGYTYNDEMRGQALLQLSQIGLQFNEMKSQNPFAYYTAAVTNSFTHVLNIEKKMQNIRDDILEANGLTPSWTRQFANDNSDQKYIDNPND